jgi:SAM-dependent methyltransferase
MDKYTKANRLSWDERVPIHTASESYGLDYFKAGCCSLKSIEIGELADVSGKSLLHLQCHFGMDTLSWANRGAIVTGVDFSAPAIEQARTLAKELEIEARFVISNVYDLPQNLEGKFDIVYTSYGVLCWLGDLNRWANVIAHFLKPGGIFYIVEGHPMANMFDEESKERLSLCHSYFNIGPVKFDTPWTYTDGDARLTNSVTYEWSHSIGEIVTALIKAGLEIKFIHEFPFSFHKYLPYMVKDENGWWRLPDGDERIPFMFSLMASL